MVYAWNQGAAMVGGTSVILSYKASTMPGPDGEDIDGAGADPGARLLGRLLGSVSPRRALGAMSAQPAQSSWAAEEPPDPVVPSAFVVRWANLSFDIDTIKGISPVWAGMPDMGFPYA